MRILMPHSLLWQRLCFENIPVFSTSVTSCRIKMSEFELKNFESPKSHSSSEKKSSATDSWEDSLSQDIEVPTHLFTSFGNDSPASNIHFSRNKKKLSKKSTQETEFSPKQRETKSHSKSNKDDTDSILPFISDSEERVSSDSECVSSTQSKAKGFAAKTSIRTNKVRDIKSQKENEKIKISDVEFEKDIKPMELKEVADLSFDKASVRNVTSISDSSYRERIRDRFKIMKEKAVESLSKPQSRSYPRLKLLITKRGSKSEDLLKEEEDRVSAAMERHEKIKLRWREISRSSLENKMKIQDENDIFFVESQNSVSPSESATAEESKSLPNSESPQNVQENSKILASEFLGMKEDWEVVENVKPEITNAKSKELWEKQLFYPSTRPVSLEDKLEPGLTPRYKEEEGLYTGQKIQIPSKIKNKMECRILKTTEGRKWFGKNGELISGTCPIKPFPTRPLLDEDESSISMQVTLKPAVCKNFDTRRMNISGNLNYVFDIDICSIDFTHHPLFSTEHVVAERLKELYLKHKKKKEADNIGRLNGRLNALRRTRNNLRLIINQSGDNVNLRDKLQKCENDIKEVRQLRYMEGQMDKQLVNKIILTWKDLLKIRETQGYQNTLLKLNIKKKVSQDPKRERKKWDEEIKEEVNEIVEELEREYKRELETYKEKYETWRQNNKQMSKQKEKEEHENSTDKISDTESSDESDSGRSNLPEEPKSPQPVSVADVKAKVIKNFKESFRQPGEPEVEFSLSQDTNTDVPLYNNKEQLRRVAVKRSMVFVKLFYNEKEVSRSKSQPLNQNFGVSISQRFAIRILEWPESLMIEIHEETGTLNRNLLVTGIYLPFPDSFTTIYNSEIVKHEFSSKRTVIYHHTAVGAGKKIIPCPDGSEFNNQPVYLYTSGTISCRVGWMVDGGKILSPPEKYWIFKKQFEPTTSLFDILRMGGTFDLMKLKEWAENSKLDPNDPYNSAFFHFLENANDSEKAKPAHFRLSPLLDEFDFCEESVINNNPRLQLLMLRDKGESEFSDVRMAPLNVKQIPQEIFKDYKMKTSTPDALTDVLCSDPLDGHRIWGKKYLKQVQEKLLKQYRKGKQNKRFQDIITEENIPDVGTLGLTFMKCLQPKRPLHPVRKERKKITPQNLSGHEISIVVNVVRAFEVPVRKDLDVMSGNESIEGFSLVNVRPFVEIAFRGVTARTTTAEGANPTWNQDLRIPVRCKNGYFSPGNIQSIKDTLYLHLFDEIVVDLIEDENVRETNIHQRLERHWLASMEIPFSTLYLNSKIEGTFKLYSPPVLLGYEREAHRRHIGLSVGQEPSVPQRDATYITLFVTVHPALNPPKPIKEKMETKEDVNLKKHLEGWHQEFTTMFPQRKIKTLVLDITGKSVCVTRYIKPLALPPITVGGKITEEMVARFVAMIPTAAENNTFPEYFDIWLTCDQVLRLLSGSCEDHAILLCSYFLQLGFKAHVLLGSGIPRGLMAYVLVKEKAEKGNKYFVWDPTNGQKYNVDDSFCPLQKVYCLIDDQNIWANVQADESPRRIKYDLTKRADWSPAFGKNISPPLGSIQFHSPEYKTTSKQYVDILRDKMEKKLRENLMKWRNKRRTQWNRYCAATLRKLLPRLEECAWNLGEDHTPDHVVELQHILASHKMCGFPINMAYTNIEAILEAVRATGVHCNENEEVEFALAVYIHSYPNDILSVWVYVASLVRRR